MDLDEAIKQLKESWSKLDGSELDNYMLLRLGGPGEDRCVPIKLGRVVLFGDSYIECGFPDMDVDEIVAILKTASEILRCHHDVSAEDIASMIVSDPDSRRAALQVLEGGRDGME